MGKSKKQKKGGGGTKLSTLIICFGTVAAAACSLSAVFFLPWYYQNKYPGFGHLFTEERAYYLMKWEDKVRVKRSLKYYVDKTCTASTAFTLDATSLKGLALETSKEALGKFSSNFGKCEEKDENENLDKDAPESNKNVSTETDAGKGEACFLNKISKAPNGIFGCGFWPSCHQASLQRCQLYRMARYVFTGSLGSCCFGAAMGLLSLIFLFAENVAGKKKKVLASARMKTFLCSFFMMLGIYVGAMLAAGMWYMMLTQLRATQQFPVPMLHVGVFVMAGAILMSTCACACSLDRFYPSIFESICPCCKKNKHKSHGTGEFFGDEDDEEDDGADFGYGGMGMYGMGPPLGMGAGQSLL